MKQLIIAFLMSICTFANAAPKPELWALWQQHGNGGEISHAAWDMFLARYLSNQNGIALLDYGAVTAADKQSLNDYVNMLAQTPILSLAKNQQLAFWINLYNALTVKTVLDNYPVSSIKEISSGFFPTGPWDDKLININDESLSLNDIEHRILRPIWQDARLHYAVNCASIGCPNLATNAYTADNVNEMLEAAAAAYINHPRGVSINNGRLQISSIYDWFAIDFGDNETAIIAHLQQYANEELRAQLNEIADISDYDYDWSLNDK